MKLRLLVAVATALLVSIQGCPPKEAPESEPPVAEEVDAEVSLKDLLEEPVYDEAELSRTEPNFETLPPEVEVVQAPERQAYRNPRFLARCRRDNRRGDLPFSERIEGKPEARRRAREMARSGELDEAVVFSRMAYGEEGTPTRDNTDGYHAMLAVIDYLRGRMSRVEMMVNYAPRRVFPMPGESRTATRQQWISELQLTGERPPSWPAHRGARWHIHPPWRTYGCPRWLATVEEVRRLLQRYRGRPVGRGPCEEVPHHWGGDMDDHDDDCHWRVIDCGNTEDTFWVIDPVCREDSTPAQPD